MINDQKAFIRVSKDRLSRLEATNGKEKKEIHRLAKKYGPILDNLNDVVFIADRTGRFIFVNKASEQRTGIPAEALMGLHFLDILDPQYHESARSIFQQAMRGENPAPAIEMERQTATGDWVTLEMNWKVISEDNQAVCFLAVCRDVTERKLAQQALKSAHDELDVRVKERTVELQQANELLQKQMEERIQAEEKYRNLFENAGDAVFIVDIETGIILDANRQAEHLTGRSRQALIGMHQSRLHPAEDAEYYRKKFKKHIMNDRVFDLEAEVVKKNGTVVPVFIGSNLMDLQGKKVIQGIFRDISKEKIISDLKGELASRKLISRAKAIIGRHYNINDNEAMRLLQRESRRQRRKLKEVAQAVISSEFILD